MSMGITIAMARWYIATAWLIAVVAIAKAIFEREI